MSVPDINYLIHITAPIHEPGELGIGSGLKLLGDLLREPNQQELLKAELKW